MSLSEYRHKRDLSKSREPEGGKPHAKPIFVVQKHDATNLHYDFRLEVDGVLWSWAVPKGPSMNPEDKRLAIMVEDHPLDYAGFEGTIPKGNYGGGTVMVWDTGIYEPRDQEHPKRAMHLGRHSGHITVVLDGQKLRGEFALVRAPGRGDKTWLMIKKRDEYATDSDILKRDKSALSKRSLDQIAKSTRSWNEGGDHDDPMPHHIKPMLATQVDEPFDDPAWVYEVKWDGYRAIAEISKKGVELYSRNLLRFNDVFGPIVEDLEKIEHTAVFDGEVVVVDEKGRSSFQRLQNYRREGEGDGELLYYVFDLLYLDGRDLTGLPLIERKELLLSLIPKRSRVHFSEHITERGTAFLAAAKEQELEGIMAKQSLSPYRVGRRSEEWLKIKTIMQQEAVIAGYTEPRGSRKLLGALVLGVWDEDELIYIGHTGGGFDDKALKEVYSLLQPLKTDQSAFKIVPKTNAPVTWIKPKVVVEVKFQEWTGDGHMRKPIFLGLRPDKHAKDVHREKAMPTKQAKSGAAGKTAGKVELTHPDKVYWPKDGYTKGDLIEYYRSVSKFILPYLKDRPESMNRFPDGIEGESFFQKNVDNKVPSFAKVVPVHSESEDRTIHYLVCENEETLLYMANLGCIEINPWNSRIGSSDHPDFLVIDLDPEDIGFDKVVEVAQHVHQLLEWIGVDSYCKTSGATGLHVYVPLGAKYDYDQAKDFAHLVGTFVHREIPDLTSLERSPAKRQKRVYLDYLQNRKGQTLASPYSVRPRPGATVSTPLEWPEVKKGLDPKKFTIKTIGKRLEKKGDLWKPVLGKGIDMVKALKKLEKLGEAGSEK